MYAWAIWIIAGVALCIAEMFTPGFFLASCGIGAIGAGIATACHLPFVWQLVIFCIVTILAFILLRPLLKKFHKLDGAVSGVDALVGKEALVVQGIDNLKGEGRVKIGGEDWKALSVDDLPIERGATVVVHHVSGVTAYVQRSR
ncbi:MAG: NfeD family protein [Sphaerochaetaceae bacterium]|nr:NfeD family protein [Sphaerochaetaceae bacterium]